MKVLFACGGTAGHINPALAVATELRRRVPECEILFVGNPDGMEATLVPRAGFDFAPFRSMGIQRRLNWNNIKRKKERTAEGQRPSEKRNDRIHGSGLWCQKRNLCNQAG